MVYDTPERKLTTENKSLVIREIEPSGIKLWIVKGPEEDRCEATDITKSHAAKSMLENMGDEVILHTKKVRSIYFVGEFHIKLNHLEGIGYFAEFAIMTDDESSLSPNSHGSVAESDFSSSENLRILLSYP